MSDRVLAALPKAAKKAGTMLRQANNNGKVGVVVVAAPAKLVAPGGMYEFYPAHYASNLDSQTALRLLRGIVEMLEKGEGGSTLVREEDI